MRRIPPIHPLLFSLYPVLFLYSVNIHRFRLSMIFFPLLIITGVLFILWGVLHCIFRDNEKAALLLSVNVFVFFSYGYACELLRKVYIRIGPLHLGHNRLLFLLWIPLLIIAVFYLFRSKKSLSIVNSLFTFVSCVLIIFPLLKITLFGLTHKNIAIENNSPEIDKMVLKYNKQKKNNTPPDIYYIILDNYLRSDILEEIYHYDNSSFLDFLSQKGFYIAEKSHSNYLSTEQSLATSLNFEYLDEIISRMPRKSLNRRPLIEMRANAKIIQFLKGVGYSYIYLSNGFESIEPKYATYFLTPGWTFGGQFLNEFQNGLMNMTPVGYILRLFPTNTANYFEQFRRRTRFAFDFLEEAYKHKGPKFVFAHIITPHDPIVFDANGNELDDVWLKDLRGKDNEEFIKRYLGELQYANNRVKNAVEKILTHSIHKPVIIIQADHGNSIIDPVGEIPPNVYLHQKFAILNAFYLPGSDHADLYPGITPVNSFRVVLNHCFKTGLPLLTDQIYYSRWETPYNVYDVTDSLTARGRL